MKIRCGVCLQFHKKDSGCFISKPKPLNYEKAYRFVTYDLETTQDTEMVEKSGHRQHVPNFLSATVFCTECIESGAWKGRLSGKPAII